MQRALALRQAWWRWQFITRARLQALAQRAQLHLQVASDVEVRPGVRLEFKPGTRNALVLGPGVRIQGDLLLRFNGGTMALGPKVNVRKGSVFHISGTLTALGHNVFSYSNLIHCSERITLEEYASTNEFVSIIDSTHHHDGPNAFFYENESSAPISVGRNTWICNKSSILMGVRVGHNCVIASHAVVNKDVADGMVVGGVPAKVLGPRSVAGPALAFFDELPPHLQARDAATGT